MSPAAERSSTSAGASTDMMVVLENVEDSVWGIEELVCKNLEKSRDGGRIRRMQVDLLYMHAHHTQRSFG